LENRAQRLKTKLGSPFGAVHKLTKSQVRRAKLPANTTVRWQATTKHATLVEIRRPGKTTHTYVVTGKLRQTYLERGGPTGKLGLPSQDARCNLPGKGCLQTFSRGTLYLLKGKISSATRRGEIGDVIAVANSQTGFVQAMSNGQRVLTKYQKWAKSSDAWCSIFQSWVFAHAGHSDLVPKIKRFFDYRTWLRKNVKRLAGPRVGALLIMDGGVSLGHTAMVVGVSANRQYLTVIDGNWQRKVRQRSIHRAGNMEFYWPY
jgi:hypothetical protein